MNLFAGLLSHYVSNLCAWNCPFACDELYVLILLTRLYFMLHCVLLLTVWNVCLEVMLNLFACHISLSVSDLCVLNCLLFIWLLFRSDSFEPPIFFRAVLSSFDCHIKLRRLIFFQLSQLNCLIFNIIRVYLFSLLFLSFYLLHQTASSSFCCHGRVWDMFCGKLPTLMNCCLNFVEASLPSFVVIFGMSHFCLVLISCIFHMCVFSYPIFSSVLSSFLCYLFQISVRCLLSNLSLAWPAHSSLSAWPRALSLTASLMTDVSIWSSCPMIAVGLTVILLCWRFIKKYKVAICITITIISLTIIIISLCCFYEIFRNIKPCLTNNTIVHVRPPTHLAVGPACTIDTSCAGFPPNCKTGAVQTFFCRMVAHYHHLRCR